MTLEDMLNHFAVIRTTFETLEVMGDHPEIRGEFLEIIANAKGDLCRDLAESRRLGLATASDLPELDAFKSRLVEMATHGERRRVLDAMMQVDVFEAISLSAAALNGGAPGSIYRYDFRPDHSLDKIGDLSSSEFTARVFDDLIATVSDDANYSNQHAFDKHVFPKFVALMFAYYCSIDPMQYGSEGS